MFKLVDSYHLRWESAAEYQTREQYSKQGRIKELKDLIKTSSFPKILKVINKPILYLIMKWNESASQRLSCCQT